MTVRILPPNPPGGGGTCKGFGGSCLSIGSPIDGDRSHCTLSGLTRYLAAHRAQIKLKNILLPDPGRNRRKNLRSPWESDCPDPPPGGGAKKPFFKNVSSTARCTIVSRRLVTPSMGTALKLPLKQTRFAGKWNWVPCHVVLPVCSRRPANDPPELNLQTRFVWPQTTASEAKFRGFPVLETPVFQRHDFAGR